MARTRKNRQLKIVEYSTIFLYYRRDDWESPSPWFGPEDGYLCCM